jgi:Flp pilus assembly protein TadG
MRGKGPRFVADEQGGVALEFAIISMALILLSLGIVEFGRALQVRNQLTFLADRGAREILKDSAVTDIAVETKIKAGFDGPRPELLSVNVEQDTQADSDGTTYRNIEISYPFTLLIPQLSSSTITLTATERVPET